MTKGISAMQKKAFLRMLEKYRSGTATPQERRFVEAYYTLLGVRGQSNTPDDEDLEGIGEEMLDEIWARVDGTRLRLSRAAARTRVVRLAAAAAVLIFLAVVYGITRYRSARITGLTPPVAVAQDSARPTDIHPGSNKAVLTLAGGQRIVLDSAQTGVMDTQGSTRVVSLGNGDLAYEGGGGAAGKPGNPLYNNITTPMGGQYRVKLSDSTTVWLNANSSLDFPAAFTGSERRVRVRGEAYFEVAGNARRPFIVEVGDLQIRVLGTSFDVAAYANEPVVKTTLAEGAVQLSTHGKRYTLRPGEQAHLNKSTGEVGIAAANLKEVLAWKKGLFYFDNTGIREIMREVARWYNASVVYETTNTDHMLFSGVVSRYSDVDALLKRLELTSAVHFKVQGNRIVVMN
jgi:hypothetical protein